MRFRSHKTAVGQVFAVSGINTISFAIAASAATRRGLLGFAVERIDPAENQRYYVYGFKVFREVIAQPDESTQVSTYDHPVQSFSWDDFTAKPGREYEYRFHPLKGAPRNLDRSTPAMSIRVRTEPLYSGGEHDVFFNRGVASSQAYRRKFGNKRPSQLSGKKRADALQWLSRDLDDALLKFIGGASRGDGLLCCFYEFRYRPVADALKAAIKRGVRVQIIIDAKANSGAFPRNDNLKMVREAKIPPGKVIRRQARPSSIQHNKFMVLLRGGQATEVWTGSTNISEGGITGQTNVGHWLRNTAVAACYQRYWELLKADPGATAKDGRAQALKKNAALRSEVEKLAPVPASVAAVPQGTSAVFSPRSGLAALELYVKMTDGAQQLSCVTLAFGVGKHFKEQLRDNTPRSHLVFLLLEKEDKPKKGAKQPFIAINASQNVYKAWGAYIDDPVYQWARETNTRKLQLNQHVAYVHSKFLLVDPLGDEPLVVTGSANFSDASTRENDENMLLIRGNRRVADIYFTEFNRLFNHYYFRAVWEKVGDRAGAQDSLFLTDAATWQRKYAAGKLKAKRLAVYTRMKGFTQL